MKYQCLLVVLILVSCIKRGPAPQPGFIPFDAQRKVLADKVISCFENDDPVIQYGYIENLNDGRGFTAGRAGFTTATGDFLLVVQLYTDLVPGNELAQYLPVLESLAATESSSTDGLDNVMDHWKNAAEDPVFRHMQDSVSDMLYYLPAVQYCQEQHLMYPLTLLCLYDACIQHGDGTDPDGLFAMIERTNQKCGSLKDGTEEYKWLYHFNQVREKVLKHPDNKETKEEWKESVGRVHALEALRKGKHFLLDASKITVKPYGTKHTLNL